LQLSVAACVCSIMEPRRDVLVLDTRTTPLPRAMLDAYHADLRAWIRDLCRAVGRGPGLGLIDALYPATSEPGAFIRWDAIGPHAMLRRQYQLSHDAIAILLVCAAPRMWGPFAHVYAAATGRVTLDEHVLARLLGDRSAVLRELSSTAPLLTYRLVSRRPTGEIVASAEVLCRLAGN
jgi:hypothetical protein